MNARRLVLLLLLVLPLVPPAALAQRDARVAALADRFVATYRETFPLYYEGVGLPDPVRDRLNANSPRDLARWRRFVDDLDRQSARIDAAALRGTPDAVTLAVLRQALRMEQAEATCRDELWHVTASDWLLEFMQIAELQSVASEADRKAALRRYAQVPAYIEQETRHLRAGLAAGYSAARTAVQDKLVTMDELLATAIADNALMSPANRAQSPEFTRQWQALLERRVLPAIRRHRDFLRNEYLPRARTNPSISAIPGGAACYRALLTAGTSVELDPEDAFARGVSRAEGEVRGALDLAQRHYGRPFTSLPELHRTLAADPANRFATVEDLRRFIETTLATSKQKTTRVVADPPRDDVAIKPFPTTTAPSGQYVPADAEGTREAVYYYRADIQNLSPAQLESTVLHEVWPGHHLQFIYSLARSKGHGHPISQLVFVPGVGEGWATYVEGLGRELSIYASDLGAMGSVMDSMTPRMVADLGVHVRGWSEAQAFDYLVKAIPALPPERLKGTLAAIVSNPGAAVPYAAGAMQIEALRDEARRAMGDRFDLRRFHELLIEGGTVPFPVLADKMARWAAESASATPAPPR